MTNCDEAFETLRFLTIQPETSMTMRHLYQANTTDESLLQLSIYLQVSAVKMLLCSLRLVPAFAILLSFSHTSHKSKCQLVGICYLGFRRDRFYCTPPPPRFHNPPGTQYQNRWVVTTCSMAGCHALSDRLAT